jgi:riboflavin kinase/FMN adenylyltransferase
LATLDHKARIVESLGIRLFVPLHFDAEFAAMEAKDFLGALTAAPVRTIAVGEDWRFGRDRAGDVALLEREAAGRGFQLETVAPVMFQGERISSTRIRQAVRDGNLDTASQMLGRPYSISGEVISGDQLGRTIGFPTANVFTGNAQLPPDGVWAVRATLVEDGSILDGVANLGSRPTVGGGTQRLEVHLFGFSGDLYGKNLDVRFVKHLRGEERFPSLDALRQQIEKDVCAARQILNADFEH